MWHHLSLDRSLQDTLHILRKPEVALTDVYVFRIRRAMIGASFVIVLTMVCVGCSEPSVAPTDQTAAEQQRQLNELAEEVTKLRQQVAEKNAAGIAENEHFGPAIVARTSEFTERVPSAAERKRIQVLSAIEELAFDDRRTATAIYEKMATDVLSLSAVEAEFASSGNGSSALARPFAEGLHAVLKQGVPRENLIEWSHFASAHEEVNWHVPILLSAATTLKLEDELELMSLCRLCFSDGGYGLSRLTFHVELLTKKAPQSRDFVMSEILDDLKREPLLKHILDDYLEWAIPIEAKKALATTDEERFEFAFNERVGSFVSAHLTESEMQDLAKLSESTRARLTSDTDFVAYSQLARDIKTLVDATNVANDRKKALKNHCELFEIIVNRVNPSNTSSTPDARRDEAMAALKDFDAGLQIIFPELQSEELLAKLLQEAGNGELSPKLDVNAGLFRACQIRKSLALAAN